MRPFFRQQLINSCASQLILTRADEPTRFVQREVNLAFRPDRAAIHFDVVVQRVNLRAELGDRMSVDLDPSL